MKTFATHEEFLAQRDAVTKRIREAMEIATAHPDVIRFQKIGGLLKGYPSLFENETSIVMICLLGSIRVMAFHIVLDKTWEFEMAALKKLCDNLESQAWANVALQPKTCGNCKFEWLGKCCCDAGNRFKDKIEQTDSCDHHEYDPKSPWDQ